MSDFIVFVKDNWCELSCYLVFLIIAFFIHLLPKRVKLLDTIKEVILEKLPHFINEVERPGAGRTKKEEVISLMCAFLEKAFPGVKVATYMNFIRDSIESILKTPQKKG